LKNLVEELKDTKDIYSQALATYTLQRAKDPHFEEQLLSLTSKAQVDDDRMYWTENKERSKSRCCWWFWSRSNDVQITSYVLLSMLEKDNFKVDDVLPIMKWLIAQRNSYGGFVSTQDTVVGLRALNKFAEKTKYQPAEMKVDVSSKTKEASLQTNKDNALIMQIEQLPPGTKSLEFTAKGTGSALIQISYQYNVAEKEKEPSFKITTNVKPQPLANLLIMDVCAEYVGENDKSNMAVLEVSLPSGYTADIERYEQIEQVQSVRVSVDVWLLKLFSHYQFS